MTDLTSRPRRTPFAARVAALAPDVAIVAGAGLITDGAARIYAPAAYLVAGGFLLAGGWLFARRG